MKALAKKIKADVSKQRQQRREQQEWYFKQLYNAIKHWCPPERVNTERRVFLPKLFGTSGVKLSKAAVAVYPVLCSLADFEKDGWVQVSQENISAMAGISIPTVRKAMHDLRGVEYTAKKVGKKLEGTIAKQFGSPLVRYRTHIKEKRQFYLYRVGFFRKAMLRGWRGNYHPFHPCIIESGVWAKLPPLAKALYLAMLCNAEQHHELYCKVEGVQRLTVEKYYERRKWDVCWTPLTELARQVGYSKNPKIHVEQLVRYGLVERVGKWFKIYLKPQSIR